MTVYATVALPTGNLGPNTGGDEHAITGARFVSLLWNGVYGGGSRMTSR